MDDVYSQLKVRLSLLRQSIEASIALTNELDELPCGEAGTQRNLKEIGEHCALMLESVKRTKKLIEARTQED